MADQILIVFAIVISVILFAPIVFGKFKLPVISSLIIAAIIIGPNGLGIVELTENLEYLGLIGLLYLLFLAGIDVAPIKFDKSSKYAFILWAFNFSFGFTAGATLAYLFGLDIWGILLLGTVFTSHSVGEVYPILKEMGFSKARIGKIIIQSTIIADIVSLMLISLLIGLKGDFDSTIPLRYIFFICFVILILKYVPTVASHVLSSKFGHHHHVQFVMFLFITCALVAELSGVHAMIGAFIAGVAVAESMSDHEIFEKLEIVGYSFFIPIFFLVIGLRMDFGSVVSSVSNLIFTLLIIVLVVASKVGSGFIAGKIAKFENWESLAIGTSTTGHMATTIAIALIGLEEGLIQNDVFSSIITLALFSAIFTPISTYRIFAKHKQKILSRIVLTVTDVTILGELHDSDLTLTDLTKRLNVPGLVLRPSLRKLIEYHYIDQKLDDNNEYYVTIKGQDMFWHIDKD